MGNFWLFYFFFCIIFKVFLVCVNGSVSFVPSLPYFLAADMLVSAVIFLLLDLPYRLAKGKFKAAAGFISVALYSCAVFVCALNFKLYSTIGSFLTYDLFLQVDDFSNFGKSIARETDVFALSLVFSALVFVVLSVRFGGKIKIPRVRSAGFAAAIFAFSAVMVSSVLYSRSGAKEFHSIDRDPVAELASSAISTDREGLGIAASSSAPMTAAQFADGKPLSGMGSKAEGMNVVIFVLESTAASYVDAKTTPNICGLSRNALVMNSHYTPEPATMKALYSIMTGRFPYATREWKSFMDIAEKDVSLPQILSSSGYLTEYVTTQDGKVYFQNRFMSRHFSKNSDMPVLRKMYPDIKNYAMGIDDEALVRYFDSFLRVKKDQRFFITLASVNPHHPYEIPSQSHNIFGTKTPFDRYRNSLHAADEALGKCYELLRKYSLEKNTLFVVLSDHGEAFYQHPRNYLHSIYLYDENVRTVSMIVNPKIFPSKKEFSGASSHVDIAPTLLGLLGLSPANAAFDGHSIFAAPPTRALFFTSFSIPLAGCRDGKYKYIFNRRYGTEELYDIEADPCETKNIASENSAVLEKMRSAGGILSSSKTEY